MRGVDAGIAEGMETDFAEVLNFLDTFGADDFREIPFASTRDSGKRAELEFAPVGHAGVAVDGLAGGGRGRNEEWVGESLFGERSRGWILRHTFLLVKWRWGGLRLW